MPRALDADSAFLDTSPLLWFLVPVVVLVALLLVVGVVLTRRANAASRRAAGDADPPRTGPA